MPLVDHCQLRVLDVVLPGRCRAGRVLDGLVLDGERRAGRAIPGRSWPIGLGVLSHRLKRERVRPGFPDCAASERPGAAGPVVSSMPSCRGAERLDVEGLAWTGS